MRRRKRGTATPKVRSNQSARKFTRAQVQSMREAVDRGETLSSIARRYDTHPGKVHRIARGMLYADAGGPIRAGGGKGSKLTLDDIEGIRDACRGGHTRGEVAVKFGTTAANVARIISGRVYDDERPTTEPKPALWRTVKFPGEDD